MSVLGAIEVIREGLGVLGGGRIGLRGGGMAGRLAGGQGAEQGIDLGGVFGGVQLFASGVADFVLVTLLHLKELFSVGGGGEEGGGVGFLVDQEDRRFLIAEVDVELFVAVRMVDLGE